MNADQFNQIAETRIQICRSTLLLKGEEYSRDGDRLHNFKAAATIDRETPERALWGMAKKHVVSVRDMISDIDAGIIPSPEMIDEKITDWINYALLLEGLVEERRCHGKPLSAAIAQPNISFEDDQWRPVPGLGNLVRGVTG